jgi:hypothetical protein
MSAQADDVDFFSGGGVENRLYLLFDFVFVGSLLVLVSIRVQEGFDAASSFIL